MTEIDWAAIAHTPASLAARARNEIRRNVKRVARLGGWPDTYDTGSVGMRIPSWGQNGHGGFDAAVACCMGIVPEQAQGLSAAFHAAWTKGAVEQARSEAALMYPTSEVVWWLAMCSVCDETESTPERFAQQVRDAVHLAGSPVGRVSAAVATYEQMGSAYEVVDGLPWATVDGGMQGAYLHGHEIAAAVGSGQSEGLWFLGTYFRTLGLEGFDFAEGSGPVHGSPQFFKFTSRAEIGAAFTAAQPSN
jgi:hypothetical protein